MTPWQENVPHGTFSYFSAFSLQEKGYMVDCLHDYERYQANITDYQLCHSFIMRIHADQ